MVKFSKRARAAERRSKKLYRGLLYGNPPKGMKWQFAPRVWFPGTRAQPYLRPALEGAKGTLRSMVLKAIRGARTQAEIPARLDTAVKVAAYKVQVVAIRKVPVRTGRLKASIHVRRAGPMHYVIGTNVHYAPYVEFGTKARWITPKRAKVLRFAVNK